MKRRSIYVMAFHEGILVGLVTVTCLAGVSVVVVPLAAVIFVVVRILL